MGKGRSRFQDNSIAVHPSRTDTGGEGNGRSVQGVGRKEPGAGKIGEIKYKTSSRLQLVINKLSEFFPLTIERSSTISYKFRIVLATLSSE
jgi:hypothetical protein